MNRAGGSRLHPDVWVAATLIVFCAATYWYTGSFREVPAMLSQNVPPTFFPRLILSIVGVLSVALLVTGAKRGREPRQPVASSAWVTAVVITAAVALVPRLGTLATVGLVSIVLPLCWGERRAVRIGLLAIALPLGVYLIFAGVLGMRFPRGFFP